MTSPYRFEDSDGDVLECVPTSSGVTLRAIDRDGRRVLIDVPADALEHVVQLILRAGSRTNADNAVTVPDIPGPAAASSADLVDRTGWLDHVHVQRLGPFVAGGPADG